MNVSILWQILELSAPMYVSEVSLRGGPPRPPMESIPLVQSHLQSQGQVFSGQGVPRQPHQATRKRGQEKPMMSSPAATKSVLIMCSDVHSASLAAEQSKHWPAGLDRVGLEVRPRLRLHYRVLMPLCTLSSTSGRQFLKWAKARKISFRIIFFWECFFSSLKISHFTIRIDGQKKRKRKKNIFRKTKSLNAGVK